MIGYPTLMRQFIIFTTFLLAALPAAASSSMTPEMDRLLMDGIDAIYRMDFAAAQAAALKATALNPDYPHPYLGEAMIDFIRYSYGTERSDASLTKSFEGKVARTIEVGERWLKTHPDDQDALLAVGSGYGISARLALDTHQYLKGWRHASRAMKYVRTVVHSNPKYYDAYLGLGMFDYYVDTIPRFAGWLAKIMLGGSRERGLRELKIASEHGHYGRLAARLILVEIFTEDSFGARNPPEAVKLMSEIRAPYPKSPMLHSADIVALYEDRRLDEATREAREFLTRAESGLYPHVDISKGRVLLGTVLWGLAGKKEEALSEFRVAAGAEPKTRWTAWARVREGQALDALGRRDEALLAYRTAYAQADLWDYKPLIKPCLKTPCVGDKYPGHFSPY